MPIERLILFGAGGHARVVIDALECLDHDYEIALCSDNPAQTGETVFGHAVSLLDPATAAGVYFHVCIGETRAREQQHLRLTDLGALPLTIRHPAAVVARSAAVAPGCFLAAGAIVSADARVGRSTIVNHAAVVDHQAVVGDFCHIAPGATLAGNASVGNSCLIGAGARLLPGIKVGNWCVLGAGAVLTADMPDETRYSGIPARRIS